MDLFCKKHLFYICIIFCYFAMSPQSENISENGQLSERENPSEEELSFSENDGSENTEKDIVNKAKETVSKINTEKTFSTIFNENRIVPSNACIAFGTSFSGMPLLEVEYFSRFLGIKLDLNSFLQCDYQFGFSRHFSLNIYMNYSLISFIRALKAGGVWIEGASTWAGESTPYLNICLCGFPYMLGIFPILIHMLNGVNLGFELYYHPYYTECFDTKVGVGISNEPWEVYSLYNKPSFLMPYVNILGEVSYIHRNMKVTIFGGFSHDLLYLFGIQLKGRELEGTYPSLSKYTLGLSIGYAF